MPRITYVPEATAATPEFPTPTYNPTWERDPSWITLPTVTAVEQKVVLLARLKLTGNNAVGVTFAGAYTVDWGDGSSATNHTSGSNATHTYDETDPQFDDTCAPVTLNATADTVERTAHGYSDGDIVHLYNIVTTTGLYDGEPYFVVNATANDFQIARTAGGTPLSLTSDGTANLLSYKQVAITITPQAAQDLTSMQLNAAPAAYGDYENLPWLEVIASCPNLTTLNSFGASGWLERINFLSLGNITSLASLFNSCFGLKKISFPTGWGSSVTATNSMFQNCHELVEVGLFTTTSVTNTSGMFSGCNSLATLPDFVFSGTITNASSMFNECFNLQTLSNITLNLASATNIGSTFLYCRELRALPATLNVSSATAATYLFGYCHRLTELPALAFTAACNIDYAFISTTALKSITTLDLSGVTSAVQAFFNSGVRELPTLDLGSVTGSLVSMFSMTKELGSVTISDLGLPTSLSGMFDSSGVEEVDIQDGSLASVTTLYRMFFACSSLRTVVMPSDADATCTNCQQMFSECSALVGAPYINLTGVIFGNEMFSYCYSLQTVPRYDLSACTNVSGFFHTCRNLYSIPPIDFSASTNCTSIFQACASLIEIPAISFAAGTNFGNLFAGAASIARIRATDMNVSFSIQSCALDVAQLDELYTNLPTVVGQTITVTDNPGTSGDDPTIATAKGWTVTG